MNNSKDEPIYTISTAAGILNISVHTLRMYERAGLIIPFRKESHHRMYTRADIERLSCIRHSINSDKLSIAGIQTIYSMIPCWDIKGCPDQEKKECRAYTEHGKACWQFIHKNNLCAGQVCRECMVYTDYSECGRIKERIKAFTEKK
jgi:MerR family transcriptional regulator, heat shock protein HspR